MKRVYGALFLLFTLLFLFLSLSSCSSGSGGKDVSENETGDTAVPENPYRYSKDKPGQNVSSENTDRSQSGQTPAAQEKENGAAENNENGTAAVSASSGSVTILPDEEHRQALSADKANDSIIIQGKEIPEEFDAYAYVKRSYEIRFLFAQTSFDSPSEMSVNKLVQYAFCHLYYEHLTDMPPKTGLVYRQAPPEEIHRILLAHFGTSGVDITKSDLYVPDKGYFEMWEPDYAATIYFDAEVTRVQDNTYLVKITFYTKQDKKTVKGKTEATVVYDGTAGVIAKFRSE